MILVDFNGAVVGTIATSAQNGLDEDLIRHVILNNLRQYNVKYREKYGQMVIACDRGSWRRDVFPQYKHKRRADRDKPSAIDWNFVFKTLNTILDEIKENLPWKVVDVGGVEADDIIGVLVEETQEFGKMEDVMIISSDKDFFQLHKYNNVRQYSTKTKKIVQEKNPRKYLLEHILKGDRDDGVPNVWMGDNTFVDEIRQKPIKQKQLDEWIENIDRLQDVMDPEVYRNYCRNKKMVDLSQIPDGVKAEIINKYEEAKPAPKMKVLNYLIAKRCKQLIECVRDFH